MEVYGLILYMLCALGISLALAIPALIFRRSRKFVFTLGATPSAAVFLFFATRWLALDYSPGCEAKVPDFQRCPSIFANIAGWFAWTIGVVAVAVCAYWGQKVIQAAGSLWFDTKPINLLKD
jgi:hypothetical protein